MKIKRFSLSVLMLLSLVVVSACGGGGGSSPSPAPMPALADADGDLVPDSEDVCPMVDDPLQQDEDGDGVGDMCEPATWSDFRWGSAVWQ